MNRRFHLLALIALVTVSARSFGMSEDAGLVDKALYYVGTPSRVLSNTSLNDIIQPILNFKASKVPFYRRVFPEYGVKSNGLVYMKPNDEFPYTQFNYPVLTLALAYGTYYTISRNKWGMGTRFDNIMNYAKNKVGLGSKRK